MTIPRRPFRSPALALVPLALILMSSAVANAGYETPPPEQQTGITGIHLPYDTETQPSARCVYQATPPPPLQKFKLRAPKVGWPNLKPANPAESGRVTWQVLVQKQTDPTLHVWKTVSRLPKQTLTVHEGALSSFTKRVIPWDKPGTHWYRLVTVLVWRHTDGSVVGSLRHWIQWYKWVGTSPTTTSGGCVTEIH